MTEEIYTLYNLSFLCGWTLSGSDQGIMLSQQCCWLVPFHCYPKGQTLKESFWMI
jgi:hypothetical protein